MAAQTKILDTIEHGSRTRDIKLAFSLEEKT